MGNYDTEQGADYGGDDRPLESDLTPWLKREWGLDVFVREFPYFQYAGQDFPATEDEKVRNWLENVQDDPDLDGVPDSVKQKGPYRTDLVAVNPDMRAIRTRARRVGHLVSLNQPKQGKRRYRRTYLTFTGDGPMTRKYWETGHGSHDIQRPDGQDSELRGYGEASASTAFGWLKKRGFLVNVGSRQWDAVDIPLHIHGRAHAFELKLARKEWRTALKQASRASTFADYRWVVYDHATAVRALANTDDFRRNGVGLITVDPDDGCEVHVWADRCTPTVDRDLLDRYNVERWDLNERVLMELAGRPDIDREYHTDGEPRITMDDLDVEPDPAPPTVHGREVERQTALTTAADAGPHEPLTSFADK